LAQVGCERVLIEGGSYQNVLVAALRAAGLPVVIINPRRVREFAQSISLSPARVGVGPRARVKRTAESMVRALLKSRVPPLPMDQGPIGRNPQALSFYLIEIGKFHPDGSMRPSRNS
jgi:hypothetical protein